MSHPDEKRIYCRFIRTESGQKFNAIIETLAMALFKDACPSEQWCKQDHDVRVHFREMAEGETDLDTLPEGYEPGSPHTTAG